VHRDPKDYPDPKGCRGLRGFRESLDRGARLDLRELLESPG